MQGKFSTNPRFRVARRVGLALAIAPAAHFSSCDNLSGVDGWPTYTVVFHANGGTGAAEPAVRRHGTAHELPAADAFARAGHGFEGWSRSPNGAAAEFAPGQTVSGLGSRINDVVNLFAVWDARTFRIVHRPNGGEGAEREDPRDFVFGAPAQYLLRNDFVKTHYAFVGWALSPGGAAAVENQGCAGVLIPERDGATVALYAAWGRDGFTVDFHPNGGTGEGPAPRATRAGGFVTLPHGHGLENGDYVFGGWNTRAYAGDGTTYAVGGGFTPERNATLYAVWHPVDTVLFRIAFRANGGRGNLPPDMLIPEFVGAMLPGGGALSRPWHVFAGWGGNPDGPAIFEGGALFALATTDVALYAIWLPVGAAGVDLVFGGFADAAAGIDADKRASVLGGTVSVANAGAFDEIRWLHGGIPVPAGTTGGVNGGTLYFDSRVHGNAMGVHHVTVEVRVGANWYSRGISVSVTR